MVVLHRYPQLLSGHARGKPPRMGVFEAVKRVMAATLGPSNIHRALPDKPYVRCEECRKEQATVLYNARRLCDHCYDGEYGNACP